MGADRAGLLGEVLASSTSGAEAAADRPETISTDVTHPVHDPDNPPAHNQNNPIRTAIPNLPLSPVVHTPAQPRPDKPRPTTRSSRRDTAAPPPRPTTPGDPPDDPTPGPPRHPGRHSRPGPPCQRDDSCHLDGRSSTRRRAHDHPGPHTARPAKAGRWWKGAALHRCRPKPQERKAGPGRGHPPRGRSPDAPARPRPGSNPTRTAILNPPLWPGHTPTQPRPDEPPTDDPFELLVEFMTLPPRIAVASWTMATRAARSDFRKTVPPPNDAVDEHGAPADR